MPLIGMKIKYLPALRTQLSSDDPSFVTYADIHEKSFLNYKWTSTTIPLTIYLADSSARALNELECISKPPEHGRRRDIDHWQKNGPEMLLRACVYKKIYDGHDVITKAADNIFHIAPLYMSKNRKDFIQKTVNDTFEKRRISTAGGMQSPSINGV